MNYFPTREENLARFDNEVGPAQCTEGPDVAELTVVVQETRVVSEDEQSVRMHTARVSGQAAAAGHCVS